MNPILRSGNWMIATPCYEAIKSWYVSSLVDTFKELERIEVKLPVWESIDHIYVGPARNLLTEIAIRHEVDGILWIDSDMSWDVRDVLCVFDYPFADLIGAVYPARKENTIIGKLGGSATLIPARPDGIRLSYIGEYLGFGFIWTSMNLIKKMKDQTGQDLFYGEHEDINFFRQIDYTNLKKAAMFAFESDTIKHAHEPGPRAIDDNMRGTGEPSDMRFI